MKKIYLLLFLAAITGLIALTGCTGKVKASLDKEFTLAIGQTANIAAENLSIKLTDVTNDSRCPEGVTCIWAGEVDCVLQITANGVTESNILVVSGAGGTQPTVYKTYNLVANVSPYPKKDVTITKNDYRMTLTVSKAP
ncbi:MAG: hypothetical protein PHE50_05270 [Dehalococcoidales bacterium]|nr:hypothetical protein [Dehalococcoidales bacterium]